MLLGLSEWFWQERRWFPKGLGWADLEDRDGRVYAKAQDLWVALPIALIFLIIRQIFERSVHLSLDICAPHLRLMVIELNWCFCISKKCLPSLISVTFDFCLLILSCLLQSAHQYLILGL
ncbi:Ceramide synthase 2 [Liparis tanakae]|uniref:Ceramide synthase 2 n=1 Tax=Liparis tanakae TaxID=230148 RepID=A0A4Z2DZ10_9TELE|nr:Ceramide synthase 2 [Liparis tanakae]